MPNEAKNASEWGVCPRCGARVNPEFGREAGRTGMDTDGGDLVFWMDGRIVCRVSRDEALAATAEVQP
jgi:hypothetical protein